MTPDLSALWANEPLLLVAGIGLGLYYAMRGVQLWRNGTTARQRNLFVEADLHRQRTEHERGQYEKRYLAAEQHIHDVEVQHHDCGVPMKPFKPPPWQPFKPPQRRGQGGGA